jgi:hypothetical protein
VLLYQVLVHKVKKEAARGWGQGGEINQALYAHMNNKRKMKKKKKKEGSSFFLYITCYKCSEKTNWARYRWLTPIILAIQKAEIRRITVQSQAGQIVHETLS